MTKNRIVKRFENWGDYLQFLATPINTSVIYNACSERDKGYDDDWYKTRNLPEAMKLAAEGWRNAEAKARKITNALVNRVGSLVERDEEIFDVEGVGIDVGLYNQGEPECMVRYEARFAEAPGPIVKIVVNIMASCGISSEVLIARGAALAGLIECIELSGKQVELWSACVMDPTSYSRYSSSTFESWVKIKEAGQPIDMGRIMFALAHPSAVRRLGFRMLELYPVESEPFIHGYGMPTDLLSEHITEEKIDVYVGKSLLGEVQWRDANTAIAWVIKKLREQNIQVNDETVEVKNVH